MGDSQADICFKGEGLCVIYLADGVAPAADVDMLAGMKAKFTSQLDGRGTKFKWDTKANAQSIRSLIDKIQGGDARFTMVKSQKLPKFADRKPAAAKKGKAEM